MSCTLFSEFPTNAILFLCISNFQMGIEFIFGICRTLIAFRIQKIYDLDGKKYSEEDVMEIYIEALNEFMQENPSFIGSKFIYAPIKQMPNQTVATYFDIVRRLHSKFPNFLAGFDLVGQEDISPGLISFAEQILQLPDDIKLFFHAGETTWFGSTDENLVIIIRLMNLSLKVAVFLPAHFFSTLDIIFSIHCRLMRFCLEVVELVMVMH